MYYISENNFISTETMLKININIFTTGEED